MHYLSFPPVAFPYWKGLAELYIINADSGKVSIEVMVVLNSEAIEVWADGPYQTIIDNLLQIELCRRYECMENFERSLVERGSSILFVLLFLCLC